MGCIAAVKRFLTRTGLVPAFGPETVTDAETDNLIYDRSRSLGALKEQHDKFQVQSDHIESRLDTERGDIDHVLNHLKRASQSAADARTIIEQIISKRQNKQHQTRKLYGHD